MPYEKNGKNTPNSRVNISPPLLAPDIDNLFSAGQKAAYGGLSLTDDEGLRNAPAAVLGGLSIAALHRREAAALMIAAARRHPRGERPLYFTSANGEVIARAHADGAIAALFTDADQILADGQPLVFASRWLCRQALPERVATTDLFHDVAQLTERDGITFYFFGATEAENQKAVATIRMRYPALRIAGRCHGYLTGAELETKIEEINILAPDILWLGLGVPREQAFVHAFSRRLDGVGLIKTAGGLFDHLAEKTPRAPIWMQKSGLEWLWRLLMEPRRLFWRYVTTNPRAVYAILTHSK